VENALRYGEELPDRDEAVLVTTLAEQRQLAIRRTRPLIYAYVVMALASLTVAVTLADVALIAMTGTILGIAIAAMGLTALRTRRLAEAAEVNRRALHG
jgi:hypothetical protein